MPYGIKNNGIALLMVIMVLGIMILMAVCFAISMQMEKRLTGSELRRSRGKLGAWGAFHYSVARLTKTYEMHERYGAKDPLYKTPDYDSPREYEVNLELPGLNVADPRGEIWATYVEDEQGKIALNSATPWLLGNLLGSAIATHTVLPTDTVIIVDSTRNFPPEGALWVNGELIYYHETTPNSFARCDRGCYKESPRFEGPQTIEAGTLVIDARAYALCQYRVRSRPGYFTPFRTVEEIRRIADHWVYTIERQTLDRIAPMLTVHSGRNSAGWIHAQKIENDLPGDDPSSPDEVLIKNSCFYRPGMTVRISEGEKCDYAIILSVKGTKIGLDGKVSMPFKAKSAVIEVLEPHPVNVNSAPPRVLHCIFKGLESNSNWIDSEEANFITNAILDHRESKGAVQSLSDLKKILEDLQRRLRDKNMRDAQGRELLTDEEVRRVLSAARSISGSRRRFSGISAAPPYEDLYRVVSPPLSSLVFRNQDTYTIEASAIVNNSSAVPIAEETIRRVVTVAPAEPLQWDIVSQKDFEDYMSHLPSFRVVSWPGFVYYFTSFPATEAEPGTGLSLDTISLESPVPQGAYSNTCHHWNDSHEGIDMPEGGGVALTVRRDGLETVPGCLSFWFYPLEKPRGSRYYLFDLGEAEWENRVRLFYKRKGKETGLSLQLCDCTVEKAACEVFAPMNLESQWYHVMAAWYSTEPGGLSLWIDGVPKGEFGYAYEAEEDPGRYVSFLSEDIAPDTPYIPVLHPERFPPSGVVRIGSEAVEYEKVQGAKLKVRTQYEGFEPEIFGRGARRTLALAHPNGAGVYPFGYSDPLAMDVHKGTNLSCEMPEEGAYTTSIGSVMDKATTIEVADASQFQASGFALIVGVENDVFEKIRYTKGTGNRLVNCQRGQFSTASSTFKQAYIFPISIMVNDNSEFPDTGKIQIEDEWLEYMRKLDREYFIFNIGFSEIQEFKKKPQSGLHPAYRGVCGTMSASHSYGAKVLPVFQTMYGWCGPQDRVTIINGNDIREKEEKEINWVSGKWAAFSDDVSRSYTAGSGTRVLKFPSGELPVSLGAKSLWGRPLFSEQSVTPLRLDELQWIQPKSRIPYFLEQPVSEAGEDVILTHTMDLPKDGGLIKIGDECMSYTGADSKQLLGVCRGFANPQSRAYAIGTPAYPVFFLPVTRLIHSLTPQAANLYVSDARDFPDEGYIQCGGELIGYTNATQNSLAMPMNRNNEGIFRGAFGSIPVHHVSGAIVCFFPARYWHRAVAGYDGPELAYFEAAKTAPGALWEAITWEAEIPSIPHTGIEIHARVDGRPRWEDIPPEQRFDNPNGANLLNLEGDSLELRVYFPYYRGAYPGKYWKTKALLKALHVRYRQPVRVWESR